MKSQSYIGRCALAFMLLSSAAIAETPQALSFAENGYMHSLSADKCAEQFSFNREAGLETLVQYDTKVRHLMEGAGAELTLIKGALGLRLIDDTPRAMLYRGIDEAGKAVEHIAVLNTHQTAQYTFPAGHTQSRIGLYKSCAFGEITL